LGNRLRVARNHKRYVVDEQQALARARLVICNSNRTADDVVKLSGVARDRTRVIYYGIDSVKFRRVDAAERDAARRMLGLAPARLLALFVGALGDRRKGFDTVFDAWRTLCGRSDWEVDLVVAGTGAELEAWKARSARELPEGRVRFLGFRRDMPAVFAACDLLIHPARYEAYGLAVHEALCRGLPALVSATAGVAERYPADLGQLLLQDPASATELAARLSAWREDEGISERVAEFAARLRARTWDHMAREIVELRGER
jgi:glycosyltransferase involved in cell wall biosynthesis